MGPRRLLRAVDRQRPEVRRERGLSAFPSEVDPHGSRTAPMLATKPDLQVRSRCAGSAPDPQNWLRGTKRRQSHQMQPHSKPQAPISERSCERTLLLTSGRCWATHPPDALPYLECRLLFQCIQTAPKLTPLAILPTSLVCTQCHESAITRHLVDVCRRLMSPVLPLCGTR